MAYAMLSMFDVDPFQASHTYNILHVRSLSTSRLHMYVYQQQQQQQNRENLFTEILEEKYCRCQSAVSGTAAATAATVNKNRSIKIETI